MGRTTTIKPVEASVPSVGEIPIELSSGDPSSPRDKFSRFRELVPLVSNPEVVYLNSSFAPPSNIIIHKALTEFSEQGLHDPNPKPKWQAAADEVRALVARYIKAEGPPSIAFTRDTTEALNSFIRSIPFEPGDNVVILDTEHPNHAYGWMALRSAGLEVRQANTIFKAEKTGKITAANADTFWPRVDEKTRAIGLSSVMFHSGQKNDVADICRAFRPMGIHVLVDLTQQVGFAPVDVRGLGVSAAGFSFHKGLNCPTGLGCMYVDPEVFKAGVGNLGITEDSRMPGDPLKPPPVVGYCAVSNSRADLLVPDEPIIFHPNAQRFEHLNLSFISIAAAKAFLTFYLDELVPEDLEQHLYHLGDELREACQRLKVDIVGPTERENHAPQLYVLGLKDAGWEPYLRNRGVYVSHYRLGVRVSLGFYNNVADIKKLADVLADGVREGLPLR